MHRRIAAVVVGVVLSFGAGARAENLREVPLGGRTATMGGAAVASGVDSAMSFLNPAGVAGTPHDIASLSADVYTYASASVPRYFRPTGISASYGGAQVEDESYDVSQFAPVPSGLTYFKRLGKDEDEYEFVLGASVTMPSYSWVTSTGRFRATSPIARLWADSLGTQRFRQALAGPTVALRIGHRMRFGLSVLGSYADTLADEQAAYAIALRNAAGTEFPNNVNQRVDINAWSMGISPVLGAQFNVWDHLWLGASFEMQGIPIVGGGTILALTDTAIVDNTGVTSAARNTTRGSLDKWRIARPARLSVGASYEMPDAFTVAADLHYYLRSGSFLHGEATLDSLTIESGKPISGQRVPFSYTSGTHAFADFSVGGEIHLSKTFALRMGFMTDLDSVEDATRQDGQPKARPNNRTDWVMGTLGLGVKSGSLETTYGFAYRHGWGKLYVDDVFGDPKADPVRIDFQANAYLVILSGAIRTDPN